ncbi:MAG TPA: hypothetical protein VK939_07155 [Longimicrobiales bacterium]|nr:hypothetical protein [Longimicrobiales bacterium]
MPADIKSRAEARLIGAASEGGFADPRPALRQRLRELKETRGGAFQEALRHYEEQVVPALAEADALAAWIEYGAWVAGLSAPGRLLAVDALGTARPYVSPAAAGTLILHVPDDTAAGVLVLAAPAAPSAAQQAALDLLVNRKLAL